MKTNHFRRIWAFVALLYPLLLAAQTAPNAEPLHQQIRGIVTDAASGQPLSFVTVKLENTAIGAITADDGSFTLSQAPLGRHTVQASFIGYETALVKEVLVGSAREVYLEIKLSENPLELAEVVVRPKINKSAPLNDMASLGARMFSVEEAGRYAGGMDDPARLASSFAGVTTEASNNNAISIHGNSPSLLQWRIEGVEVANINHFADITQAGGGFLSALSSNVLGNSDFFIGAFPAEYGNAVAGVFDMRLRNGNDQTYQHAFQFGVQGIDFASEGPISKKNKSSYLINYRYATIGLLEMLDETDESMNFQDLNFKLNFPTRGAGTFSVWGVGLVDKVSSVVDDPAEWKYIDDGIVSAARLKSGATGLSHRYFFGNNKTSLHTTLAATLQNTSIDEDIYDLNSQNAPMSDMTTNLSNLVLTSSLNHKFNARHTNKTGLTLTRIHYDMLFDYAPLFGDPLENYIDAAGNTSLLTAYSSSKIKIGTRLTLTAGLNAQYLALSQKASIEPRAGLRWQASARNSFAIAYGLHSRMEKADAYFVEDPSGRQPNRKLGFTKSHHLMLAYAYRISDNMNLRIEPYYQYLFNVPVTENGAYSILNREMYYITEVLVDKGLGRNYGIDLTLEKYLSKGLYWMLNASLYESKYRDGNRIWHDTRYNRNFVLNALAGKEWMLGNNVLGLNLKASLLGGQRYTPVDEAATLAHPDLEAQYDESQMYALQFSPQIMGDLSLSYRINRPRLAHEFAVKTINITGTERYMGHKYNLITNTIEPRMYVTTMINVSYRIEF
jgi:hypothetical protein